MIWYMIYTISYTYDPKFEKIRQVETKQSIIWAQAGWYHRKGGCQKAEVCRITQEVDNQR